MSKCGKSGRAVSLLNVGKQDLRLYDLGFPSGWRRLLYGHEEPPRVSFPVNSKRNRDGNHDALPPAPAIGRDDHLHYPWSFRGILLQ